MELKKVVFNPSASRVTIWLQCTCDIRMPLFDIYSYFQSINTYINCLLSQWIQIIIVWNFVVFILFWTLIQNCLYSANKKYRFTFSINSIHICIYYSFVIFFYEFINSTSIIWRKYIFWALSIILFRHMVSNSECNYMVTLGVCSTFSTIYCLIYYTLLTNDNIFWYSYCLNILMTINVYIIKTVYHTLYLYTNIV